MVHYHLYYLLLPQKWVQCSPKGPFTSIDCDDAAISLRNQIYVFGPVLLHTAFVTATATSLGDRFVSDSRATSLRFWSRSRCM